MWARVLAFALPAVVLAIPVFGEEWSRARINRLPDSAFAVVEVTEDGTTLRRLPHHDERGDLDLPHLRSALSRLGQVRWLHPESGAAARRHLEEHRPAPPEVARVPAAVARLRSRITSPP